MNSERLKGVSIPKFVTSFSELNVGMSNALLDFGISLKLREPFTKDVKRLKSSLQSYAQQLDDTSSCDFVWIDRPGHLRH